MSESLIKKAVDAYRAADEILTLREENQRLRAALHKITQIYDDPNLHDLTACHEMNRVAKEALSTTTEPTGPYTVRRDVAAGINTKGQPFAVAIERNGYTVLHLQPGTERNEQEVEFIVDMLNGRPPEDHLLWDIKGLLENWDFRAIAAELENGYDKGVLVELVELCEKLTGAKSPRSKTEQPKTDKTCVMCGTREGKYLSTANRWFCEPCTDALPPVTELVGS